MDRLTFSKHQTEHAGLKDGIGQNPFQLLVDRLADYEDAEERREKEEYIVEATGSEAIHIFELLAAEAAGLCVTLPYKRGDRIYIVDNQVRGSIRTTQFESYLIYPENLTRVLVKCTANSGWHNIENVYHSRAEAEESLKNAKNKAADA